MLPAEKHTLRRDGNCSINAIEVNQAQVSDFNSLTKLQPLFQVIKKHAV